MTYVMWLSVLDTTLDLSFCICFVWIVCVCICICGQGFRIFLAFWLALRWHCDVWVQVNSTMHVDKTDCSEHKFDQAAPALAWLEAAVGRRNVKATGADTKNFPANVSWEFAGCLEVLTFNAFSLNRSFGSYFVGPPVQPVRRKQGIIPQSPGHTLASPFHSQRWRAKCCPGCCGLSR